MFFFYFVVKLSRRVVELDWGVASSVWRRALCSPGGCVPFPAVLESFSFLFSCYSSPSCLLSSCAFAFLLCPLNTYCLTSNTSRHHVYSSFYTSGRIQFSPDPVYPDVASDLTVQGLSLSHRTTPTSEAICKWQVVTRASVHPVYVSGSHDPCLWFH